ncbi:hypothetical protein CAEBREN_23705 [Caenorhabditis brenneri]|uniref:Uncharacterized protein n=1 Tax=Caenorhabditis brenneri TaxID=135651 RepID=G0PCR6_CAEBE|nr:hypothetical protein CAEBREN_23705 [Caenorhabditis brenneri]
MTRVDEKGEHQLRMFVHTTCAARNSSKFGEAKCSNCGHGSTIPRSTKLRSVGKVGSISSCCSGSESPCISCKDQNYKKKPNNTSRFGYKVKPCFCRKVFHFGCLRPLIDEKPYCSECGVVYDEFVPATTIQFFMEKWKWYILYIAMLSIFSTLFIVALNNSLLFTKSSPSENHINKEIMLTLVSVFFLIVICATMFTVIKYTLFTALPKYRIVKGKVMLKPFKTGGNTKPSREESMLVSEKEFEEIPLCDLRRESAGEQQEPQSVEAARGNEIDDITLGQHMFGVYATHHSSSTPIDKPSLGFVFNSA